VAPPSPAVAAAAGSVPGVALPPSPQPPSPALTVRILGVVRSVYEGDWLPRAVNPDALPAALGLLIPLAVSPTGGALAASALLTTVVGVRAGLGAASPPPAWGALASAACALQLVMAAGGAPPSAAAPPSTAAAAAATAARVAAAQPDAAAGAVLTVRVLGIVHDALTAGSGADAAVRASLVDVLATVGAGSGGVTAAAAGAAGTAAAAASMAASRTAQTALLCLATRPPPPPAAVHGGGDGGGAGDGRHAAVASAAASAIVRVASGVLGRYATAAGRSGWCPLPAGRSSEAAALLAALAAWREGAAPPPLAATLPAVAACATVGTGEVRVRATALLRTLAGAAVDAAVKSLAPGADAATRRQPWRRPFRLHGACKAASLPCD